MATVDAKGRDRGGTALGKAERRAIGVRRSEEGGCTMCWLARPCARARGFGAGAGGGCSEESRASGPSVEFRLCTSAHCIFAVANERPKILNAISFCNEPRASPAHNSVLTLRPT